MKNMKYMEPSNVSDQICSIIRLIILFFFEYGAIYLPSGKLTVCELEHGHRNSGFTQLQNGDFQ